MGLSYKLEDVVSPVDPVDPTSQEMITLLWGKISQATDISKAYLACFQLMKKHPDKVVNWLKIEDRNVLVAINSLQRKTYDYSLDILLTYKRDALNQILFYKKLVVLQKVVKMNFEAPNPEIDNLKYEGSSLEILNGLIDELLQHLFDQLEDQYQFDLTKVFNLLKTQLQGQDYQDQINLFNAWLLGGTGSPFAQDTAVPTGGDDVTEARNFPFSRPILLKLLSNYSEQNHNTKERKNQEAIFWGSRDRFSTHREFVEWFIQDFEANLSNNDAETHLANMLNEPSFWSPNSQKVLMPAFAELMEPIFVNSGIHALDQALLFKPPQNKTLLKELIGYANEMLTNLELHPNDNFKQIFPFLTNIPPWQDLRLSPVQNSTNLPTSPNSAHNRNVMTIKNAGKTLAFTQERRGASRSTYIPNFSFHIHGFHEHFPIQTHHDSYNNATAFDIGLQRLVVFNPISKKWEVSDQLNLNRARTLMKRSFDESFSSGFKFQANWRILLVLTEKNRQLKFHINPINYEASGGKTHLGKGRADKAEIQGRQLWTHFGIETTQDFEGVEFARRLGIAMGLKAEDYIPPSDLHPENQGDSYNANIKLVKFRDTVFDYFALVSNESRNFIWTNLPGIHTNTSSRTPIGGLRFAENPEERTAVDSSPQEALHAMAFYYFREIGKKGFVLKEDDRNQPKGIEGEPEKSRISPAITAMLDSNFELLHQRLKVEGEALPYKWLAKKYRKNAPLSGLKGGRLKGKSVMGMSASDALDNILLDPNTLQLFRRIKGSHQPGRRTDQEWCHLQGDGDNGPSITQNFVAGSDHCNTEQLALEEGMRPITTYPQAGEFFLHSTAYLLESHEDTGQFGEHVLNEYFNRNRSQEQPWQNTNALNQYNSAAAFIRYKIYKKVTNDTGTGYVKHFDYTFEGQGEFFDVNQYTLVSNSIRYALLGKGELITKYLEGITSV